MKQKVLIVTFTEDKQSTYPIEQYIKDNGGEVVYWHIDQYLTKNTLSSFYKDGKWQVVLVDGEKEYTLNDVTAVWNRRYTRFANELEQEMEAPYFDACLIEAKEAARGLMTRLEKSVFMLNGWNKMVEADIKEVGLQLAVECGLKIPKTYISNDPKTAFDFIQSCKNGAISKTLRGVVIKNEGERSFVQTNDVSNVALEDLESLRYCPMIFQERVAKKVELRITIVGEQVFAASIDSQKNEKGQVDWRKAGVETINEWQAYDLPKEIEENLLRYQKASGLNYGAADVIVTPNDEYIFLEINAAGEFNWLDHLFDFQISAAIGKVLMGKVPRF